MNDRIQNLRRRLEEPLLVSSPVNVRYLTGLVSSNAAVLVEPDRARLFTDFRYAEAARAVKGVELVELPRDLFARLAETLSGRIGFEAGHLTYARYETLAAGGLELVARRGLVEGLRAAKDEAELAAIRRGAAIANEVYERLAAERFVGRTERDLAWLIESSLHELGAQGLSFPVIVASGPTAALPHADPGERVIGEGETVIVDVGCVVEGYCSDCTRTFVTGELPEELARAYEVCLRAQEAGLTAVAPGADGVAVDRIARDVIDTAGLGERFGHGLGHGVGLEVHEQPWLNHEFPSTLAPGNVVTVEPGIYLPGLGGVRIEDLVVVGVDGPEVLTTCTKELVTVH